MMYRSAHACVYLVAGALLAARQLIPTKTMPDTFAHFSLR